MKKIFLSLGSNIGNRAGFLAKARKLLKRGGILIEACSHLYETKPWGGNAKNVFLNQCIAVKTRKSPRQILRVIKEIEKHTGRIARGKWTDREIDIDILLYGDVIVSESDLTVPHPFLHERRFVLEPLAEIAPEAVHPIFGKNIADLSSRRPDRQAVKRLKKSQSGI